jgi:hypothetical protein
MWFSGWSSLFGHSTTATVAETTARIHESGLFAAHWSYQTHGETHRLSCSHLHRFRHEAERCGASINATIDRLRHEHKAIGTSYVAERLHRNPTHEYLGVHKEEEIA